MNLEMPCINVKLGYPRCIHGLLTGYKMGYFQEPVNNNKNRIHAHYMQGKEVYNPSFDKASLDL
jgi:hypothetical protein